VDSLMNRSENKSDVHDVFDRLVVIGGGQMARALVHGFIRDQEVGTDGILPPLFSKENVFVCVHTRESKERWLDEGIFAQTSSNFYQLVEPGGRTLILIAIKPQEFATFQDEARRHWAQWLDSKNVAIVSVMAGICLEALANGMERIGSKFPRGQIARLMPNLNANSGNGTLLFCATPDFPQSMADTVVALAQRVGSCTAIREKEMNAASALTGCAPAFIYTMIEALADGGVLCGLSRSVAHRLAAEMVRGSASHVLAVEKHPAQLKDAVCSPGGTTIAGMRVLEREGMRSAFIEALTASTQRALELGEQPQQPSSSFANNSGVAAPDSKKLD